MLSSALRYTACMRVFRCFGYVVLGLATSVASAWLCATGLPHKYLGRGSRKESLGGSREGTVAVSASRHRGVGQDEFRVIRFFGIQENLGLAPDEGVHLELPDTLPDVVPWWCQHLQLPTLHKDVTDEFQGCAIACGWPVVCLWSRSWPQAPYGIKGGIDVSATPLDALFAPTPWPRPSILPTRGIPLGMVANTAFYGMVWFVLFTGIGAAHRWRRRCRGLCTRCAYDRTGITPGQPCPECGTLPPLPKSTSASA